MKKNLIADINEYVRQARKVLDTQKVSILQGSAQEKELRNKQYERMPSVALPRPLLTNPLDEVLKKRTSSPLLAVNLVDIEHIGALLGTVSDRENEDGRSYPSGGAKYPIEVYLVGTVGEYANGVFHYNPMRHELDHLWPLGRIFSLNEIFGRTVKEQTSFAIIFTAVWERTSEKYGEFGYQLALLEAGHMGQNILLAAAALGLGARPFCGYNEDVITEILDIDEGQEQSVYTIQIFL